MSPNALADEEDGGGDELPTCQMMENGKNSRYWRYPFCVFLPPFVTGPFDLTHIHDSHASCFHRPTKIRQTSMSLTFQWESYDDALPPEQLCDSGRAMGGDTASYQLIDRTKVDAKTSNTTTTQTTTTYQGLSGHDLMYKEGLDMQRYLRAMKGDCYDNDLIFQTSEAPPVKRVHAVYGINIPTEVSAFYHQADRYHSIILNFVPVG